LVGRNVAKRLITAVRRCRVATRRAAEPATHSAKERSDFAERMALTEVCGA